MGDFAGVRQERPTAAAHRVVEEAVEAGDLVVDATAGNGHDTVFLARLVGEAGRVIAFDVQEPAIRSTAERLEGEGLRGRVDLRRESHGGMLVQTGRGKVSAVMFNLGYLPGGDHGVITECGETGKALVQALFALREGGVMTVVCYTGHPGGEEEAAMAVESLKRIREEGSAGEIELEIGEPAKEKAPFLVVVRKR